MRVGQHMKELQSDGEALLPFTLYVAGFLPA